MIKKALEYLVELGNKETFDVGGQVFSTGELNLIPEPTAEPLRVRSLSAVVDYLINNYDGLEPVMIHVVSHTEVRIVNRFNRDKRRDVLLQGAALLPDITFERFMGMENFNIMLQSCFVPTEDRAAILKLVGNVKEEAVKTTGDDGISQTVTAKQGITTVAEVKVPNPVELKPFRTFIDIPQSACSFVFRMQDGPSAALFEAAGGAWKLQAMASIKEYLQKALYKQIEDGFVTIIA